MRAIERVSKIKGSCFDNKNNRHQAYLWIASYCGYSKRTKYRKQTYKLVRSYFPSPDGTYTGYKPAKDYTTDKVVKAKAKKSKKKRKEKC